jgi:hypothetical protein
MPNESVQEYLDRVTIKEKLHKTPESFLFTIIKRGLRPEFEDYNIQIKVITKLPNSEQSYKGKVQTHNYINRQNQSSRYS